MTTRSPALGVAGASGIRDVKEKVRELVGLTAQQFSQVILLPQGRFEKVLRAGSDEREVLLKTLFDTELYEQVADHLDRSARAERDALGDLENIEYRARKVAEDISLALQGSLLVRHGHPAVAEAFLATRMARDWGGAFGTLPAGLDLAPIIERALVKG